MRRRILASGSVVPEWFPSGSRNRQAPTLGGVVPSGGSVVPHPLGWEPLTGNHPPGALPAGRGGQRASQWFPLLAVVPCEPSARGPVGLALVLVGAVLVALAWCLVRARATLRTLARAARRGHGEAALRILAGLDLGRCDDDDEPPASAPPASGVRPSRAARVRGPAVLPRSAMPQCSAVLPRWRGFTLADVSTPVRPSPGASWGKPGGKARSDSGRDLRGPGECVFSRPWFGQGDRFQ